MKRLNLIIPAAFFIALCISACSKSDNKSTPKTKTELLTQAPWKFSIVTVGGVDASGLLQTCQKDNIYVFTAQNTGTLDEGIAKCGQSDPQTIPFTWAFESNETILNVSTALIAGGNNKFSIIDLSETQLKVSQNITIGSTSQTAIVTFIH